MGVLSVLQTKCNHRAISLFQKVSVKPFAFDSAEHHYMGIHTSYALSFVVRQIKLADKVKIKSEFEGSFEIESTTQCSVTATSCECNCSFRKTMQLPCRLIFAMHRKCEILMFYVTIPYLIIEMLNRQLMSVWSTQLAGLFCHGKKSTEKHSMYLKS